MSQENNIQTTNKKIPGSRNITKMQWKKDWRRFKDLYFNAPFWSPSCPALKLCWSLYRSQQTSDRLKEI